MSLIAFTQLTPINVALAEISSSRAPHKLQFSLVQFSVRYCYYHIGFRGGPYIDKKRMCSLLRLFCISRQIVERTREERLRQMHSKASVVIVEEPATKLERLGGESEDRTDTLVGVKTTCEKTTYPSIKIVNYTGTACVIMSCVTEKKAYL